MPIYHAVTRPLYYMENVCAGRGPISYEPDWCAVRADNPRQAKGFAVRAFRQLDPRSELFHDGYSPFKGLTVQEAPEEEIPDILTDSRYFDFTDSAPKP